MNKKTRSLLDESDEFEDFFNSLLKTSETAEQKTTGGSDVDRLSQSKATDGDSHVDTVNPLPYIAAFIAFLVFLFGVFVGLYERSLVLFFVIALLSLSILIGGLFSFFLKLRPTVERIARTLRERQGTPADKQRHRTTSDHSEEAHGKRSRRISTLGGAFVTALEDSWELLTFPATWLFILPIAVYGGCKLIATSPPAQAVKDIAVSAMERNGLLNEAQRLQDEKEFLELQISQLRDDEIAERQRLVSELVVVTNKLVDVRLKLR